MEAAHIAFCGMNCALCHSFQNNKTKCPGCRSEKKEVRKSCRNCVIAKCEKQHAYCFECTDFPCKKLKQLDTRYRTRYGMSMIDNLEYIKNNGMRQFLEQQEVHYKCNSCGEYKTVHCDYCVYCRQNISLCSDYKGD